MIREDLKHPLDGITVREWIRDIALRIEDDQESLWTIVGIANVYGLEGEEKIEFIRRCLCSLLDAGAFPVVFMNIGDYRFGRTDKFGTERDEIVENVIADWQAKGSGDLEWGDYPFTLEENMDIPR